MDRNQTTEAKGQIVRRTAFITSVCTFALCPIECVCVSMTDPEQKKVKCGHYKGSRTDGSGSVVKCGYQGE